MSKDNRVSRMGGLMMGASAFALAATVPLPAFAQLDEIIVTATKREASIQSLSQAITAVSGSDLDFRGATATEDLQFQVPNLFYGESTGTSLITIRGVGLSVETGFAEQGVASHVDGVFLPRPGMTNIVIGDLERVEVLRGPQGTLYGRNSTGGIINYITRKPTEDFEAGLTLGGGSFTTINANGYVSGPLVEDKLLARVYVDFEDTDGYIENPVLGSNIDEQTSFGLRGSVRYLANESFTLDMSVNYLRREGGLAYNQATNFFGSTAPFAQTTPNVIPSEDDHDSLQEVLGVTGTATWEAENFTVKSITSYYRETRNEFYDSDGVSLAFTDVDRFDLSRTFQQELNINGTAFDGRLDWIAGGYFFYEDAILNVDIPTLGTLLRLEQSQDEQNVNYAGFTDLTYSITDQLRVIGGVRISRDERNVDSFLFNPLTTLALLPPVTCTGVDTEINKTFVNPKGVIEFDATDDVMLFAGYQRGSKPGGKIFGDPTCGATFGDERVEAIEGGFKSSWMDGNLVINASGFYYDYSDYQVFQIIFPSSTVLNAPEASAFGAEVEIFAAPTENTRVNFGASYLNAEFDRFSDTDSFGLLGLVPGIPGTPQDLSGNKLARAPEFTINAGAEGTWPIPNGGLFGSITLRGEVFYTTEIFFRQFNESFDRQDGYAIGNIFVAINSSDEKYQLRGFVKNVGDTEYIVSQFSNASPEPAFGGFGNAATLGLYGRPRSWGVELSAKF